MPTIIMGTAKCFYIKLSNCILSNWVFECVSIVGEKLFFLVHYVYYFQIIEHIFYKNLKMKNVANMFNKLL